MQCFVTLFAAATSSVYLAGSKRINTDRVLSILDVSDTKHDEGERKREVKGSTMPLMPQFQFQHSFRRLGFGWCTDSRGTMGPGNATRAQSLSDCITDCGNSEGCHAIVWVTVPSSLGVCFLLDWQNYTGAKPGVGSECWKQVRYVLGKHGSNSCPAGYKNILTASACQAAGSSLGFIWIQAWNVGTPRSDRPNGCYAEGHVDPEVHMATYSYDFAPYVFHESPLYFNPYEGVPTRLLPGFAPICEQDKQSREEVIRTRVRVVEDVIGKAHNRWVQEGEKPFQLFQEDLGTVNSFSSTGQVGVILDKDVEKQVWVNDTYLVEDDPPLKEADENTDTLIQARLKGFPRAKDMATFKCPITKQIFRVPVVASDGRTYENSSIQEASNGSEPVVPNYAINSLLKALMEEVEAHQKASSTEAGEDMTYQILDTNPPAFGTGNVATFRCPISQDFLTDPVVASDGHTYERKYIEDLLRRYDPISPMDRKPLSRDLANLFPNRAMRTLLSVLITQADPIPKSNHVQEVSGNDSKEDLVREDEGSSGSSVPTPKETTGDNTPEGNQIGTFRSSSRQVDTCLFGCLFAACLSTLLHRPA